MANDRVYLRCRTCKATVMLATFWGGGEFLGCSPENFKPPRPSLGEFLEQHTACADDNGGFPGMSIPAGSMARLIELISEADLT